MTARPITRYRATDGTEFAKAEDAETHSAYLRFEQLLYANNGWGGYSQGYDGPMPYTPRNYTAKDVFEHRHKLRNFFLDLPEPKPVVIDRPVPHYKYKNPIALCFIALMVGIIIGRTLA
jgi:hypothetical protein